MRLRTLDDVDKKLPRLEETTRLTTKEERDLEAVRPSKDWSVPSVDGPVTLRIRLFAEMIRGLYKEDMVQDQSWVQKDLSNLHKNIFLHYSLEKMR